MRKNHKKMFCNTGIRPVRAVSACCWIFRYGKFRYAFEKLFAKGNGAL